MDMTQGEIDEHRPWIRDARDNPGEMNWAQTLLNPLGETSKLHFSRAWTFMFLGRVLLYLVPSLAIGILGITGMSVDFANTPVNLALFSVPAVLLPFAVFTVLTEFTSFIAHTRRLANAARPTWLAVLVLVPMILGLVAYAAGTGMGAAQHRQINAPPPEASTTAENPDAKPAEEKAPERRGRRGPPGPPQSEREMAVASGVSIGLAVWALCSFGVMIWTLVYVARLPNGGQGRLRTGSDLTPEEIAEGVA